MQNYCKTIGALAAASALVAGTASAEVEYEIHTGYTTQSIYRGTDLLGEDLVEVGVDAATEWNGLGFSAGAWYGTSDTDFGLIPSKVTAQELNLYGQVSKDLGFATGSIGYIYRDYEFGFPAGLVDFSSQEVYFSLARDLGFAQASLTYYWGVRNTLDPFGTEIGVTDGYTELALSRAFPLNECLSLNVGTNVGYLVEGGDFTARTTKVALDYAFTETATLSPFIGVSVGLGESNNTIWQSTENELFGGSMLSVRF